MITLRTLLLRMIADLADGYDVVIVIDGNDANRHGPVGTGKSNFALWIAHAITALLRQAVAAGRIHVLGEDGRPLDFDKLFRFNVETDLIIRDDLRGLRAAINDRRFGKVIDIDETEWFLYNEWHSRKEVTALTPEFMSNRKEGRVWILLIPTIWKLVDFFRETRVQWRIRMESRNTATIFMRGPARSNSHKKDLWGVGVTQVRKIPRAPQSLWGPYQDRVEDHVCAEKVCVSMLRQGK